MEITEEFDGYWYRCEIRTYSRIDDFGDVTSSFDKVEWTRFGVLRNTPKGVKLVEAARYNPKSPEYYLSEASLVYFNSRFVCGNTVKQWACPTTATALRDMIARKEYHIAMCKGRLNKAENQLTILKALASKDPLYRILA
jgi:hypothetical protein